MREWGKENKDRLKEYQEKRYNKHHDISVNDWVNCKNYFNNCCAYCGLHIEEHFMSRLGKPIKSDFHKEHVAHDGANDISNCVPSCKSCNSEKGTFLLQEWYNESNIKFTNERMKKINKWLTEDYLIYK